MAKVGIPLLKLTDSHKGGQTKRKGNQTRAMGEALEERWSNDPDLDRTKTKDNVYFDENLNVVAPISGVDLSKAFNEEAADYKEEVTIRKGAHAGQTFYRGLKSNAVTGGAIIIKPEIGFLDNLTDEEEDRFWSDTMCVVSDIVGKNEKTGRNNLRAAVLHKDEKNRHVHGFFMPYKKDGRLCADEFFTLKLYSRFNREFPKRMRELGWDIDDCVSYDLEKVQRLEKEAAELSEQGKEDEAAAKRQEIEDYKQEHIKEKKAKKNGISKKEYVNNKLSESIEQKQQRKAEIQQDIDEKLEQQYSEGTMLEAAKNAKLLIDKELAAKQAKLGGFVTLEEAQQDFEDECLQWHNRKAAEESKIAADREALERERAAFEQEKQQEREAQERSREHDRLERRRLESFAAYLDKQSEQIEKEKQEREQKKKLDKAAQLSAAQSEPEQQKKKGFHLFGR